MGLKWASKCLAVQDQNHPTSLSNVVEWCRYEACSVFIRVHFKFFFIEQLRLVEQTEMARWLWAACWLWTWCSWKRSAPAQMWPIFAMLSKALIDITMSLWAHTICSYVPTSLVCVQWLWVLKLTLEIIHQTRRHWCKPFPLYSDATARAEISNIFQTYPRISIFSKSSVISCDVILYLYIYIRVCIYIYVYILM